MASISPGVTGVLVILVINAGDLGAVLPLPPTRALTGLLDISGHSVGAVLVVCSAIDAFLVDQIDRFEGKGLSKQRPKELDHFLRSQNGQPPPTCISIQATALGVQRPSILLGKRYILYI